MSCVVVGIANVLHGQALRDVMDAKSSIKSVALVPNFSSARRER